MNSKINAALQMRDVVYVWACRALDTATPEDEMRIRAHVARVERFTDAILSEHC